MNQTSKENIVRRGILILNSIWVCCFLLIVLNRNYPNIGHDYTYFLTHLFDTFLHYRVNGLSIQWYTPSFGGGLPAYANPQHTQFSLPQLLVFFFDPWTAYLISILMYATIGLVCFYLFAKHVLGLDWRASLLGALFFVCTGFYIGHMIAGQMGFLGFPLLSAVILVLFWKRWSDLVAGIVIALLASSLIYQAGFYTLVIFGLSGSIAIPMLYLTNQQIFSFRALFRRLTIAGLYFAVLSASKVYAIYTLMRYFPRTIPYAYSSEYTESFSMPITSFVAQLLGTTTLAPLMAITGQDVNLLQFILSHLSGYPYSGLWETDNAISPVLIGILVVGVFRYFQNGNVVNISRLANDKRIALLIMILAIWFSFEFTVARGWLYTLVKQLPVFSSLHINYRFTSIFFLPLALLGAFIVHNWLSVKDNRKAHLLFAALNLLTLISPLSYFLYSGDVHDRMFDISATRAAYQQSKMGETFPVTYIAEKGIQDWEIIPLGATTILPYEAVFGYANDLQDFNALIHPGPIFETANGYFNMTNPASLTFPEENGGRLFSLFAESDRERLEQFTHRRQPDWNIPTIQVSFNYISAIAFVTGFMLIFVHFGPGVRRQKTGPDPK